MSYLTLLRLREIISIKSNIIQKGKKYIKPGQKAPKGVRLHKGPKGGTYYLIEDKHMKIGGKHHELIRSKGVTKDQWDEITQKHLNEGAESVEFIPQPEYGGKEGQKLYNIYVRRGDTDQKIENKIKADKEKFAQKKKEITKPEEIPNEITKESVGDDWIRLGTSNKVGRARNLANERGVPMKRIHEIYQEAEKEATQKYLKHKSSKDFTEQQRWVLYAMYSELAEKIAIEKVNAEQPPAVEEGSVKAFLLSGKTYPLKSDIKYQFHGKWDRDAGGWMIHGKHADAVKEFAEKHGLTLEETETEGDTFRMRTPEERREIRAERNQRKASRIRESAEKKLKEGEASWEAGSKMMEQIPFGQPILVGHHSEQRDRNYRSRAYNKMDQGHQKMKEANAQLERANRLEQTPRMKGDTARAREEVHSKIREKAKSEFVPGKSQVDMGFLHGHNTGIIVKLNEKSALVYNPQTYHSHSVPLVNLKLINHEGIIPDKKELQNKIKPEKTISKQEWDRKYPEDKRQDQYSRIRYIREGSYATGRGWVPVKVE